MIDVLMEATKFTFAILSLFSGSLLQLTSVSSLGVRSDYLVSLIVIHKINFYH